MKKGHDTRSIEKGDSYVISVRNPDIQVQGFPYEKAQLLLIGAHRELKKTGIKVTGKSALFKTLGLNHNQWPKSALIAGKFAKSEAQVGQNHQS
ncbi:MAG: hypothetical protein KDD58_14910 [Bdellovibrionales bacterium]|nr:hypothetical protein [Bdellovibrionales bacterium]